MKQKNFNVKGNCLVPKSISIINLCEVVACDKNIKMEKLTLEENVIKIITSKDQGWDVVAFEQVLPTNKKISEWQLSVVGFQLNFAVPHLIRLVNLIKF